MWQMVFLPVVVMGMFLVAIVGLGVLAFDHTGFVLLPEGLLLTVTAVIILGWLRRHGADDLGPAILRNPINQRVRPTQGVVEVERKF
jgi:hypothetical protein